MSKPTKICLVCRRHIHSSVKSFRSCVVAPAADGKHSVSMPVYRRVDICQSLLKQSLEPLTKTRVNYSFIYYS